MYRKKIEEITDEIKVALFDVNFKQFTVGFYIVVDCHLMTWYLFDAENRELEPREKEFWIRVNGMDSLWKTQDALNDIDEWYNTYHSLAQKLEEALD